MKNFDSVKSEIFDLLVQHFELMRSASHGVLGRLVFVRYLIGAELALKCAFDLDFDSTVSMMTYFNTLLCEYFGGKESE